MVTLKDSIYKEKTGEIIRWNALLKGFNGPVFSINHLVCNFY